MELVLVHSGTNTKVSCIIQLYIPGLTFFSHPASQATDTERAVYLFTGRICVSLKDSKGT